MDATDRVTIPIMLTHPRSAAPLFTVMSAQT
jgi:hypothetical protein